MDDLKALRIARIVLFAIVIVSLLALGTFRRTSRPRVVWGRILWLLFLLIHELIFFVWVDVIDIRRDSESLDFAFRWTVVQDIHAGLAFLVYVIVLLMETVNHANSNADRVAVDRGAGPNVDQPGGSVIRSQPERERDKPEDDALTHRATEIRIREFA